MKESMYITGQRFALLLSLIFISFFAPAQWVRKADGLKPRSELGPTVIYNSKIYNFVGYSDAARTGERTSEVYDPATDSWSYIASVPVNTVKTHQGTLLIDNTIWHLGGRVGKNPGPLTASIWIYDINDNSWSQGPDILNPATGDPMPIAASGFVLLGRTIHIFGGFTPTACTNDQDRYHLTLDVDTWLANRSQPAQWKNTLKPMPQKRNHISALTLGGKIYAFGGQTDHDCGGAKEVNYCHVYNPSTNTWKQLPSLPSPRSHNEGATFAIDGKIYMVGGQGSDGGSTTKVTIFDPQANNGTGAWSENTSLALPNAFEGLSATVVGSTFIIAHGSLGSSRYPQRTTYTRTITRNPVYKLGFPSECLNLSDSSGSVMQGKTWLFTIDGTKNYTTSSDASWLTISKNATGTAKQSAVDIQVTANTSGFNPGVYYATVTATGTGSGPNYTLATLCVKVTVEQSSVPVIYNLSVATSGSGSVSKNPDRSSYNSGTSVLLTATANQGQQFNGWSGSASGTSNPLTVVMNSDKNITASFGPVPQYNLTVNISGNGTVQTNPNQGTYANGSGITLTASPGPGQQFNGWSGDATGGVNPLSVVMNSNKTITANFGVLSPLVISNIVSATGRSYILGQMTQGTTFFSDRDYVVTSVPAFLNNAPAIKTANSDKSNKSATLFSFDINQSATIYIAYDPRATALPGWLNSWQKLSGQVIGIQDPAITYMQLYSKVYPAGKVTLSGNMASPAAGALSNYFVIALPQQTMQRGATVSTANDPAAASLQAKSKAGISDGNRLGLHVYPNPNSGDKVHVFMKSNHAREFVTIGIYDAQGKIVILKTLFTDEVGAGNAVIFLKGIRKGLYSVRAYGKSVNEQLKLVVN